MKYLKINKYKGYLLLPHQWGLIYTPGHEIIKKALIYTLYELYKKNAYRLLQISYYQYIRAFMETPEFTDDWGDFMGGRVIFQNKNNKKIMENYESHWKTKRILWK